MKRLLSLFLATILWLSTAYAQVFVFDDLILPANKPRSSADFFIPLNGSFTPTNNADLDDDGVGDMGTGAFVNADATNRMIFDPDNQGFLRALAADEYGYQKITGDKWKSGFNQPGGTNYILQSREFDTTWTKVNLDASDLNKNATGIDESANSAWTVEDDDGGTYEYITQTITVPDDNNTHCVSIFIAKDSDETRFLEIQAALDGGSALVHGVQLNTKTGAMDERVDDGGDEYGVIDMADYGLEGWWRLWLNITNDTSNNTDLLFNIIQSISTVFGNAEVAATGSIIIDQAQVELNQSFPSHPIITTTTAVSRTDEAGYPTWTIPASGSGTIFSEDLSAEIATGTLILDNTYKITSDTGDDFYVGSAVGEYFISDGTETCDADSKVKQVINPSSEGGPPRGTVVVWWRPGAAYDTHSSTSGILCSGEDESSLLYYYGSSKTITKPTPTTYKSQIINDFAAYSWQKLIVQYGYLVSNVPMLRIGLDTGSGVSWVSPSIYVGSYDIDPLILSIGNSSKIPFHISSIAIWCDPSNSQAILSGEVLDAQGSP